MLRQSRGWSTGHVWGVWGMWPSSLWRRGSFGPSGCLPKCKVGYRADRSSLCRRIRHNSLNLKQGRFQLGMCFLFPCYEDNYALALACRVSLKTKVLSVSRRDRAVLLLTFRYTSTRISFAFLLSTSQKQLHNSISISTYSCITTRYQKVWKSHTSWETITLEHRLFFLYLCDTGCDICKVSQALGKVSQESLSMMDWQNEPQRGTSHTNDLDPKKKNQDKTNKT